MRLRDDLQTGETGHAALHNEERRALNTLGLYADRYDSVQAALNDAAARAAAVVYLTPGQTYDLDATVTLPASVCLDGGGQTGGAGGATLRATSELTHVVSMGQKAAITGVILDGNNTAHVGVRIQDVHSVSVESCGFGKFARQTDAAIRAGGALYTTLKRNVVFNIAGVALDALKAYGGSYFGINHGLSEQNTWGGRMGSIRIEGMLTSVTDDFELALDGEAVIVLGGTIQSQLNLIAPYFEVNKGQATILQGIIAKSSTCLTVQGGEAFGDNAENSRFIHAQVPSALTVTGVRVARWHYGFTGNMENNASVMVAGNYFTSVRGKSVLGNIPAGHLHTV